MFGDKHPDVLSEIVAGMRHLKKIPEPIMREPLRTVHGLLASARRLPLSLRNSARGVEMRQARWMSVFDGCDFHGLEAGIRIRELIMTFRGAGRAGAFSLAMLLSFAAEAAVLDAIQGGVLVSRGGGAYQTVSQPTPLRVGDSVLANPGSGARVVFENGCAIEIEPGMVFTVGEAPPCDAADTASAGSDYTMVAVGAAVVAGGVGIAIAAGGGGGGDGGSP